MFLIDLGDAMVETKQMAPGARPDNPFVFGLISGGWAADVDLDVARMMLRSEVAPE